MTVLQQEVLLIVLPFAEPSNDIAGLRNEFPDARIIFHHAPAPSGGTVKIEQQVPAGTPVRHELWKDVTLLVTIFHLPSTLAEAPRLRHVHLACTGVNHIVNTEVYKSPSIAITTSSGCASPQIAEWVMMTALASNWDFSYLHEKQRQHRWLRTTDGGQDAHNVHGFVGQRIGILGYGSIGRQIAKLARAFGMEVFAYTATPKQTPEAKMDTGYVVPGTGDINGEIPARWFSGTDKASLHEFLGQDLDMLVLCTPSTKQTANLLGKQELGILCGTGRKPFLTNISRGAAIDQEVLINCLASGKLRGAALDVQDPEPLPPGHPLWDAPNVIITPHMSVGGVTDAYIGRVFEILALNIQRERDGKPLLNAVNRAVGY